jgi:predicted alpha-1,6-mannanase (GH76 family)
MGFLKRWHRWWAASYLAALHETRLGLIRQARQARRMHMPVKAIEHDLIGVTREILSLEARL